ncbi:hypothetical protein F070042J6_16380 [Bacteroides sp. f07]
MQPGTEKREEEYVNPFHIAFILLYCKIRQKKRKFALSLGYLVLFSVIANYPNKEEFDNNTDNRLNNNESIIIKVFPVFF